MFSSKLDTTSLVTLLMNGLSAYVLVSLRKVPGKALVGLVQVFYQQWLVHSERGNVWVLRQAMLTAKQDSPVPLSWAAFTLIGLPK